jgi:hypothetical protein
MILGSCQERLLGPKWLECYILQERRDVMVGI